LDVLKLVRDPRRISRNAHKIAFCKLLRARLNEPPPLHRLLSQETLQSAYRFAIR
jgi:hypothetical protein